MKHSTEQELTIGNLAAQAGVGVETVRFYERKGLIKQPAKRSATYRKYTQDDAKRIRFIKRAQGLGFTLSEIKEFFALSAARPTTCDHVKKSADVKLAEIEEKIKDLQRMKRSLKELMQACGDGPQALMECRILDCFETGQKCY